MLFHKEFLTVADIDAGSEIALDFDTHQIVDLAVAGRGLRVGDDVLDAREITGGELKAADAPLGAGGIVIVSLSGFKLIGDVVICVNTGGRK